MSVTIVKLGGSLAGGDTCRMLLDVLSAANLPLVVVPGGGPFADAVRTAQGRHGLSDLAAHRMAILAMAQYGLLLADQAPRPLRLAWGESAVREELAKPMASPVIWLPDPRRDALELEASWDVTSDSLALWLATRLGAHRLVLVKSCESPADRDWPALAEAGIVDAAFPNLAARAPQVAVTVVYAGNATALRAALAASI